MNPRRLKAYSMLIATAAIWGAAGPIVKFTLGGISPFSFLAYRFTISGIFALIFILVRGVDIPKWRQNILPVAFYGFLAFTVALSFLFNGLDRSSMLDMVLIATAAPLLLTVGGALFFHDHVTKRERVGITIAVVGVLINTLSPLLTNSSVLRISGNIMLLAFLLFDSSAALYSKHLQRRKIPSVSIVMVGFVVAMITLVPIAFWVEGPAIVIDEIVSLEPQYHLGVWYMAIVSGLLGYFLAIRGQRSIEISEAALFFYLQPLVSVPLAVFWLGESLTPSFFIGATIIATGVFIAELKKKR